MPENTEQVHYVSGQHKSAIQRHAARTASNSASFLFPYLDKLPSNFRFLDLGCGPGSITTDLAGRYPQARFEGVDGGERQIAHARELAEQRGTANARFSVGDILALDGVVEWGAYDVVYCHQVLVHMQRPVEGLRSMRRAARADGGLVAARESFGSGQHTWPEYDGIYASQRLTFELIKRNGSDNETGRKLVDLALQAGWKRDQITAGCGSTTMNSEEEKRTYAESLIDNFLDSDSRNRQRAMDAGLADEATLAKYAEAWRKWLADDAAWHAFVSGEIVCVNKP